MATTSASVGKTLMHPAAKPLVFVVCLLPFAWLLYAAGPGGQVDRAGRCRIECIGEGDAAELDCTVRGKSLQFDEPSGSGRDTGKCR